MPKLKKGKRKKLIWFNRVIRGKFRFGPTAARVRCPKCWLTVTVRDSSSNAPLPGVQVQVGLITWRTTEEGIAEGWVRCGRRTVQAHLDGHVPFYARKNILVEANTENSIDMLLTAPRLVALTVISNATQDDVTGIKNWATIKNNTGDVIVEVETDPDTKDAWKLVAWSGGGDEVPDHRDRRAFSRAVSKKLEVTASLGNESKSLNIWVLWAQVTILTAGTTPADAAQFENTRDGTEVLGVRKWNNNSEAAGKIVAVGKLTPQHVGAVVQSKWNIKRDRMSHDWNDGNKVAEGNGENNYWNTAWVKDDSYEDWEKRVPVDDTIYDTDAPNIAACGLNTAETYNNFKQYVTWHDEVCSDEARWYWAAHWEKNKSPQVTFAKVGTGNIKLPENPWF